MSERQRTRGSTRRARSNVAAATPTAIDGVVRPWYSRSREAASNLIARTHPPPLHVPPKPEPIGVDDARLLPHLRERSRLEERTRLEHQQAAIFRNQHAEALAQGRDTTMPTRATAGGDRRKLRGIPVQARGVGSVQPGTQPEQQATRGVDDTPSDVTTFLLHANARRRAA